MRKLIYLVFTLTLVFMMTMIGCNDSTNIQGPDVNESLETAVMQNPAFLSGTYDLNPFTPQELANTWVPDRQFPSGGTDVGSAFDRDNVLQIIIDSDEPESEIFPRTEGMKTAGVRDFGNAVKIDLYLDPDWENKAVRAGFWVAGVDDEGDRDNWFGILEFVNLETSTSGESPQGNHEGFRIWDSSIGWTENPDTDFQYGEWVTLGIELNPNAGKYTYYINGVEVGTANGGNNYIGELFLNSYNYGLDEFPDLGSDSYTASWHISANNPQTKADCKKGYDKYGFDNQGRCIQFVNTGRDSR